MLSYVLFSKCIFCFDIKLLLNIPCGLSFALCRLADLGHVVVGVEVAEMAIKDFFKENKLEFSVGPVEGLEDAEMYTVGSYLFVQKKYLQ